MSVFGERVDLEGVHAVVVMVVVLFNLQASDEVSSSESESNGTATVTAYCRCAAGWHGARCQSRTTDTCEV